jgi:ubiquitin-activating enzyme E1
MDQRCVFYVKPLLDSGTLGTKGNTQVVVPHLTESYGSSQDPPEKETPSCTVKNFPNAIQHTIEWSRQEFDNLFVKPAQAVNAYLSEPNYLESTLKFSGQQKEQLEQIVSYLVTDKPLTFEECIVWARLQFEEKYNNSIRQLLFSLPKDSVTSTGQPFWSGPKRAPEPLTFDSNDVSYCCVMSVSQPLTSFSVMSPLTFLTLLRLRTSMPSTTGSRATQTSATTRRWRRALWSPSSHRRAE